MDVFARPDIFKIRRNLSDAGLPTPLIGQFMDLVRRKKRNEQYHLLARHRMALLDELHRVQYKIDCLDYLVYAMEREDEKKNGNTV